MKFLKSRKQFLNEAKIRELILPRQAKQVSNDFGEKYLDYEDVTPTDKIIQGKWKLSEDDKYDVLSEFYDCNMKDIFKLFNNLPDKFNSLIIKSLDLSLIKNEKNKIILNNLNIKNPSIDQIIAIYNSVFRKLSVSETMASEIILKDESGRPVKDDDGNMIKTTKKPGDPIFSNNLIGILAFIEDYNRCYPDHKIKDDFNNSNINSLRNLYSDMCNSEYNVDHKIFDKDMYLSIFHNPKDILNMSISKFYASCQHLYSGGYRNQLLGNVFDPNSIPAFLIFETPIFWGDDKISDQLPLCRMQIRSIETFNDKDPKKIFFDRSYPDRMKSIFDKIITKYSGNKANIRDDETYIFTPDIDQDDSIYDPYMDRLNIKRINLIGKNTKRIYLNRSHDWSNYRISPDAKIKEIVIETDNIPENLTKIPLNPDWIKFKFMIIKTMSVFNKILTDSLSFDKCKIEPNAFDGYEANIKKLQIISCNISNNIDLSKFNKLEELHLVYTLSNIDNLKNIIDKINIKKLVISGDLYSNKSSKEYIKELRKKIKVEIIGPII